MVGIIVVGHGEFAKGVSSSVELIAGKQENYETIDFTSDITPEVLSEKIEEAIVRLNNEVGVLIFTDLKGGTPFKEAVESSLKHDNVKVIAGTNIAMLLEAALMRVSVTDITHFAKSLVETGKDQVDYFDIDALSFDVPDNDEDGI